MAFQPTLQMRTDKIMWTWLLHILLRVFLYGGGLAEVEGSPSLWAIFGEPTSHVSFTTRSEVFTWETKSWPTW